MNALVSALICTAVVLLALTITYRRQIRQAYGEYADLETQFLDVTLFQSVTGAEVCVEDLLRVCATQSSAQDYNWEPVFRAFLSTFGSYTMPAERTTSISEFAKYVSAFNCISRTPSQTYAVLVNLAARRDLDQRVVRYMAFAFMVSAKKLYRNQNLVRLRSNCVRRFNMDWDDLE